MAVWRRCGEELLFKERHRSGVCAPTREGMSEDRKYVKGLLKRWVFGRNLTKPRKKVFAGRKRQGATSLLLAVALAVNS